MKSVHKIAIEAATKLNEPPLTETQKPQQDISEKVTARFWQWMTELYGRQWEASYGLVGGKSFQTWHQAFAEQTPAQVKTGLDALVAEGNKFPPSLLNFLRLCNNTAPAYYQSVNFKALPAPGVHRKPEVIAAKNKCLKELHKLLG